MKRFDAARAGLEDPETGASTFTHLADLARREIHRAARHGRRFALLRLSLDGLEAVRQAIGVDRTAQLLRSATTSMAQSVREYDVLSRGTDREFYLLLPETGLVGAVACRRRIHRALSRVALPIVPRGIALGARIAIAIYPHDGTDLVGLLRSAGRRAELSTRGVADVLELEGRPFWDNVERLLGTEDDSCLLPSGEVALHPSLERTHDTLFGGRHAVLPEPALETVVRSFVTEAIAREAHGVLYLAGHDALASSIGSAIRAHGEVALRAFALGGAAKPKATLLRLPIDDPRLDAQTLFFSLTDLGGYAVLARRLGSGFRLVYHSADLDVVDAMIDSLKNAYHLQPELDS